MSVEDRTPQGQSGGCPQQHGRSSWLILTGLDMISTPASFIGRGEHDQVYGIVHRRSTEMLAVSSVQSPRRDPRGLHDCIMLVEHAVHNRLHMDMTWGANGQSWYCSGGLMAPRKEFTLGYST